MEHKFFARSVPGLSPISVLLAGDGEVKPGERDIKPQPRCTVQLLQAKPDSYFSTSAFWAD